MKTLGKSAWVLAALLALAGASTTALADRDWHGHGDWHGRGDWHEHGDGHVHFGLYFGAPLGWSDWDDPPPYYYSPPRVVVVPSSPPVYVQQPQQAAPSEQQSWWYYCPGSRTYYPYVKQCPGGWQRVAPQPPPG